MKKKHASLSAFFNPRALIGFAFCTTGLLLAVIASGLYPAATVSARETTQPKSTESNLISPMPDLTTAGQLIISEFRVRGPSGAADEFIELYNTTGGALTAQSADGSVGLGVAASDGLLRCFVPNGTVIPAGGHFLCTNSNSYSLSAYPAGSGTTATGNQTYGLDIPDQGGIALFNNAAGGASFSMANRLDAVGPTGTNEIYREGSGLPALTPFSIDYSWVRRLPGGCTSSGSDDCNTVALVRTTSGPSSTQPQDTNDNAADFIFVDTNGTSAGGGQRLGAPGPQNVAGPGALDGILSSMTFIDACALESEAPNYVRNTASDPVNNSTFGTVDIRRTFTNNTGAPITRLRFRVVDITTFPAATGVADLRPRTSSNVSVTVNRPPCSSGTSNISVQGTVLEQPPAQPNGGGYNTSMSVDGVSSGSPLAPGASIDVRFLLGVQQSGVARFCVVPETVPASASQVSCFTPIDITPGAPPPCGNTVLNENFDSVTAPNLPGGWVSSFSNGAGNCTPTGTCTLGSHWATNTITPDTPPNSVFHNDPNCVTDASLDSPPLAITSASAQLMFRHSYNTEANFDGGVLEIAIGPGAFTDILAAGGSFVTGGYNRTISTAFLSPIAGRPAWSASSGGFLSTQVTLPAAAAGQTVRLRFRLATDCSVAGVGWRIDTISVREGSCPPTQTLNISTRMRVETGNNVLIGGFIISGNAAKNVVLRGIGPSLIPFGVTDALADPMMELRGASGAIIAQNDNWQSDSAQAAQLTSLGLSLQDPRESGIAATLQPGTSYTAILSGTSGGTGVGLVEVYDTNQTATSQLANISTRGFVQTGNGVMIGGFILGGGTNDTGIVVRGIGPSLIPAGVSDALADPTLELRDNNGATLVTNDDWQDDPASASQLTTLGLAPSDPKESGIFAPLPPGPFTAILAGKNGGTGVGLVEIYNVH